MPPRSGKYRSVDLPSLLKTQSQHTTRIRQLATRPRAAMTRLPALATDRVPLYRRRRRFPDASATLQAFRTTATRSA